MKKLCLLVALKLISRSMSGQCNVAADGTITIKYIHRKTAYTLSTDKAGTFNFSKGDYVHRGVGFTQGAGPPDP